MPSTTISTITISEYQALVSGIPKFCPNASFIISGQTFTAAQAVTFLEAILTAVSAVAAAKTGWTDARLAAEKLIAQDGAVATAIRNNVAVMFNNNTTTLAAFEIAPKKPRQPLSAAARAAATAKSNATREARGTTSKKQKALVSGNVTGVTITPITAPTSTPTAPAAAPTAPAPSAPAAAPTAPAPAASTTPAQAAVVVAPVTTPTPAVTPPAPSPATPAASNGAAPASSVATHP